MKRLLIVPLLGLTLAGCTVSVTPIAPTISNVSSQATFCTQKDTRIDFKFNYTGVITRLEVTIVPEGASPDSSTALRDSARGFTIGSGRVSGFYDADTNRDGQVSGLSAGSQAIIVSPANSQLYLRAFNGTASSGYVMAGGVITPSGDNNVCDPGASAIQ